ncbi:MAG: hypothetical protein QME90_10255 [Thermodesulfobacteriota bacterium]|nr:hypothetical protein [Thermodesulfobacteriota bacterium]
MSQLHKRFTSDQVKELLERYLKNEVERKYIQEVLGICRRRFFMLLKPFCPFSLSMIYPNILSWSMEILLINQWTRELMLDSTINQF